MISPLHILALDSDVCPTSVPSPVAPLNTYTFLKIRAETPLVQKRKGPRDASEAVLAGGPLRASATATRVRGLVWPS